MLKLLKKKTKRKSTRRKTAKRKSTRRRTKATPAQLRARKKFAAAARKAGGKVRKGARLR